jgi:anti-sigma regulatory factor (Ser/Thr protein kinase)
VPSMPLLVSQLTLAELPSAVPWARRHADEVLRRWRVPPDTIETALLIVSELAANSIRHAPLLQRGPLSHSAPSNIGTITLLLRLTGPHLVIQVGDRDPHPPVLKTAGNTTGGSALCLVNALSSQWGHYRPRGRPGKIIWAELRLDVPARLGAPATQRDSPTDPRLISRILAGLREL